jgi:acetyl-CoA/propionyl-CoA carboxylase, biotin carboxylase, biotin carboxyl carrier protein
VGPLKYIGPGVVQVEVDGRTQTLYVAGPAHDRWVYWNGRVFRGDFRSNAAVRRGSHAGTAMRTLSAPMPATIVTVHVKAGDAVTKGQVLMLLEAMKMELPIRAPGDAVVAAVRGSAGDLVQADTPLIEFQS